MIALSLLAISLPASSQAQVRMRGPAADLDQTMLRLTEELDLTEGQAVEVRDVLERQNEQSRVLIEEARASGEGRAAMAGMRERMRRIQESAGEEIEAILSVEQQARYEEMLAARAAERGRRRGSGGG